jgi:TRAP-type C4-dicarboxylate transport system permease small subunit
MDMIQIASVIGRASKILNWFGVSIVLTLLMVLVAVNAVMRYGFNLPIIWAEDVVGLMLITLVFFALSYCWVADGHVRMTLLYDRLSGRGRAVLDVLAAGVGLFFWGLLFCQSLLDILSAIKLHEILDVSGIILWPFRIVLSVGLLMLNLQFVLSLIDALTKILRKEPEV